MNRQEMFDKMWNGLKAQGWKPSTKYVEGSETCAYRGKNGMKCAFGHLISDEDYPKVAHCEGNSVDRPMLLTLSIDTDEHEFLTDAQGAHDRVFFGNNGDGDLDMETRFRNLAQRYKLIVPE